MIKYLLNCKNCRLEFESWFASSKEFDKLKKLKLLNCQQCNSQKIEKSLMKPNLANSNFKRDKVYKNNKNVKTSLLYGGIVYLCQLISPPRCKIPHQIDHH